MTTLSRLPSAELLFDTARTGMAILDPTGRFGRANPALCDLLGVSAGDLIGRSPREVFGAEWTGQGDYLHAAGTAAEAWLSWSTGPLDGGAALCQAAPGRCEPERSEAAQSRILRRDSTLEEQLRRAQRLEAVGRLAGGVAHDFNNMLSVVLNYAEFAKRRIEDPTTLHILDGIRRAGERSAALTRQLMIFAGREVEAGTIIDLNAVVLDLLDLLQRTLGEDVQVETQLGGGPAWVLLAVPHAEQVFVNLAVNARDAMPGGGTLTIHTGVVRIATLDAGGGEAEFVELMVSDTGTGMTPEVLAHLFEPFFTTKGPGAGTGLGLSTVYGIVDQAGGHIEVQSAVGVGTTFRIRLPVHAAPEEMQAPEAQPATPLGAGQRVLVVEDQEEVRGVTARLLTEAGYAVTSASGGAEALSLWSAGFDVVLTDVVMPGMSGVDLAKQLRHAGALQPIVFMSGHADGRLGDVPLGRRFVRKPFDAGELLRALAAALGGAGGDHGLEPS